MAEKEITNEKAAKHIWNNALQRSFQPFSWGLDFSSIKTIENGTAFHVKAAWVHIQYMMLPAKRHFSNVLYNKAFESAVYLIRGGPCPLEHPRCSIIGSCSAVL